jgi:hypothetical protein
LQQFIAILANCNQKITTYKDYLVGNNNKAVAAFEAGNKSIEVE